MSGIRVRPLGYVITTGSTEATISDDGSGYALFTSVGHGLINGSYIYIESNIYDYNGFWYVTKNTDDTFWIREAELEDKVSFVTRTYSYSYGILSGDLLYYTCNSHEYLCAHLPIVYKINSTKWPINSETATVTVSSISNDAGYVQLTLSGGLETQFSELDFLKITGQNAGIYQIISISSSTVVTIDFPYSAGLTFAGSSVQYYFKDYAIRVKVYSGLESGHLLESFKPMEEVVELSVVPNSNGDAIINISDYLKSKIEIDKNDTMLGTLPNDINSFTQFYISWAESYSQSNGYSIGTTVGSYVSDSVNFVGVAVNAMLPFKNQYSGALSDYIKQRIGAGKFLTGMREPCIFSIDQYFDISFLVTSTQVHYALEQFIVNGAVVSSQAIDLGNYDVGVYRHKVTYDSAYEAVRVTIFNSANVPITETLEIKIVNQCFTNYTDLVWKNNLGGHDYWRFGAGNQLSISSKSETAEKNIYTSWPKSYGAFADTINRQTKLMGNKMFMIRSQHLTHDQAEDIINGIETSLLVQIQNSRTDKRTVIVSGGNALEQTDRFVELNFKVEYTDQFPVQSL